MIEAPILLVEDNPDDEMMTLRALKKNQVANEVIVARDGEQALDYLFGRGLWQGRDTSAHPALVLLDLKLPKLDGIEVLREIRENEETKIVPVVILTTSREERDVLAAYRHGANSFVQKPVDFKEFSEAVRQLGVYWLLLNQSPIRGV